ncbi:MAG: divalent metal cation transporter, partial [Ginsengibacter sp.]
LYHIAEIQDASAMLETLFGKAAPIFFGIALIAAGQSSTITGTLAGQIVMEGHLNLRIQPWLRRMITRIIAIIPALITIIYFGERALGSLLVLSQVVLSLQLGFAVIPLIHFTSSKILMKNFVIPVWLKISAWVCAAVIVYLNIQLVLQEINIWSSTSPAWVINSLIIPISIACLLLLAFVFFYPLIHKNKIAVNNIPHGSASEFSPGNTIIYNHIGITIDFSGNDQRVIQNALQQGGTNATYTLIHIVESAAATYLGKNTLDHETKTDKDSLDSYKNTLTKLGYGVNTEIGFGAVATEISKIVHTHKIDLLVMGAHGHRGITDWILGTTVNKLRHKINIPVLIIR